MPIVEGAEASFSYWFGTVRFVHFVAAFVFFFNFVGRIYWGFAGNRYARLGPVPAAHASALPQAVARGEGGREVDVLQAKAEPIESTRSQRARRLDILHQLPGVSVPVGDGLRDVRRG